MGVLPEQAVASAISPEVSGIADRIVMRLEEMAKEAKTYRAQYEDKWRRCKKDRASEHDRAPEEGRANYFIPLASTYSGTWVASNVQAQLPQPQFFITEAYEEPGKDFEQKMAAEMLHICQRGRFERAIRESYWNFWDYGFTALLVQDDPELDIPRPEVVPCEDVWVDGHPLSGTRDERVGRFLRRVTTVSDLLLEQEQSGGRKYDQAALDSLVNSLPSQQPDKPQQLDIWTYWGDIYITQDTGQPTRLLSRWQAIWVDKPAGTLLACSDIDTPGGLSPLHIFCYKTNPARDLYGEPIGWAGVGIQGLSNSVLNQGLDLQSKMLKPTPWLRKGSDIARKGIVFGQPIVSERADDVQNPLQSLAGGAGGEAIFALLPMLEQEYARAVGATHTHSIEETPRTATEQAIRSAVVEVRTKHGNELAGEGFGGVIEQMQQLRAKRMLQAAMDQAPEPDEMADGEPVVRRSVDSATEVGWEVMDPAMWGFRYSVKLIGPGILSSRAERMIGTQSFFDVIERAAVLDPTIPARFKAGDTIVKRYYSDATGYDHQELLIPIEVMQRMMLILQAQARAEMAQAAEQVAGNQPASAGDKPNGEGNGSPLAQAEGFTGP